MAQEPGPALRSPGSQSWRDSSPKPETGEPSPEGNQSSPEGTEAPVRDVSSEQMLESERHFRTQRRSLCLSEENPGPG